MNENMNANEKIVITDQGEGVWKNLVAFCYKKLNENPWLQLDLLDYIEVIPDLAGVSIREYLTSRYGKTIPAELIEIAENTNDLMRSRRDRGMEVISGCWKRLIFVYLEYVFQHFGDDLEDAGRVSIPNLITMEYNFKTDVAQPLSTLHIPVIIWSTDKTVRIYDKIVNICHLYNGMWYVTVVDKKK